MRICGQWFDKTIRARIDDMVQRVPDISRSALAERICHWLGWNDRRGQPQLGGARKVLAELGRRGAVALPPSAARGVRAPSLTAQDALGGQPVTQANVTGDLAGLGTVVVERADTAAQIRYLFSCPAGYLGAAAFQSASFALKNRDQRIGWNEPTRRGNLDRVVANARFLIPVAQSHATLRRPGVYHSLLSAKSLQFLRRIVVVNQCWQGLAQ